VPLAPCSREVEVSVAVAPRELVVYAVCGGLALIAALYALRKLKRGGGVGE
jgi:hypothetical protein